MRTRSAIPWFGCPDDSSTRFVRLPAASSHSSNFSSDGKAATLIFARMHAFADHTTPIANTVAGFILPIQNATGISRARIMVRGYVLTDGAGSAALALNVGGRLHEIDLQQSRAEGVERSEEAQRALDSLTDRADSSSVSRESVSNGSFDYSADFTTDVSPGADLHITLILGADRVGGSEENAALLWVDSLDVLIEE